MYVYRYFIIIGILFCLVGCGTNSDADSNIDIEYTNLSTTQSLQQDVANMAKETLSENEDITSIKAVNTKKDMIIAFEIHHLKRFRLQEIREKVQEEMDQKFSDFNVIVSTDQKIFLELDRLEDKIFSDSISKKELNKKIKELVKLDKEQT